MIQENIGVQKPSINASRFMLQIGRIADGILSKLKGKEPALTKSIINSALNRQTLSNRKIKKELNYEFEPVPAQISKICELYRSDLKTKA
jgi:riboflavin synthase alpha subunit